MQTISAIVREFNSLPITARDRKEVQAVYKDMVSNYLSGEKIETSFKGKSERESRIPSSEFLAFVLSNPDCTVSDISNNFAVSGSTVWYHLKRLRFKGMINCTKIAGGKTVWREVRRSE